MKTLSKAALAAALIAGTGSIAIVMPAEAKKKEEAAPTLKLSNEVRAPIVATQTALAAKDYATAETSLATAEAAAKTGDEKYITQALRLQLIANKQGPNVTDAELAPPLDALIANPSTPPAELGRFSYVRANMFYNAKQYPQAVAAYTKAQQLNYVDADLPLRLARAKIYSGDAASGAKDVETLIATEKAAGRAVPEDLYTYTITALQKTPDTAATLRWTRDWLYAYPTQKNWHTAIYVFGFQGANDKALTKRERIDLFRLLRATNSLAGQNEYLEYASLAVETANASEAKAIIEEGKAKGKIPATDPRAKDTLNDAATQLAQEGSAAKQEKDANASAEGLVANGVGDFALGSGNYAKAIEMYQLALKKGGARLNRDEVNTHLGIAYLGAGDKAAAKAAFVLVTTGLRGQMATLWTTWVEAPGATTPPSA